MKLYYASMAADGAVALLSHVHADDAVRCAFTRKQRGHRRTHHVEPLVGINGGGAVLRVLNTYFRGTAVYC